jgi:hypothetical protein
MLPQLHGLLIRELRRRNNKLPVIILSGAQID